MTNSSKAKRSLRFQSQFKLSNSKSQTLERDQILPQAHSWFQKLFMNPFVVKKKYPTFFNLEDEYRISFKFEKVILKNII